VIDLHFHLLPGIDDGPTDLDAAVALARAAASTGVDTIVATPHVSWDWQNTAWTIVESARRMDAHLAALAIPIRVRAGAEIALTRALDLPDEELRRLTLGGGPWLLVEPPHMSAAIGIESVLLELQHRGHRIVLAHVERCPAFIADVDMLERLVQAGMLASMTAGSLVGRFGRTVQRFARRLVTSGLIHNVASDAHDCHRRPPGLSQELASAGLRDQTAWLTEDVPAAILAGSDIPPAPVWRTVTARPRLLGRLLRR
jgi:protein-tyrosine phosphatase